MPTDRGRLAVGCAWLPVTLEWAGDRVAAIHLGSAEAAAGDPPPWVAELAAAIHRYWAGDPAPLPADRLDWGRFTPFQERVYRACHAIPPGRTRTYGELADAAGSPRAARAVGQCMRANPYPLVIPCHRVLAAGGGLGGFSGGLDLKRRLLAHEGTGNLRSP